MTGDGRAGSADALAHGGRRGTGPVGRGLRVLRADLWTTATAPLPPLARPRLLRWLPHVVLCLVAVPTTLTGRNEFVSAYELGVGLGTLLALVQGGAVVLALRKPLAAWWTSLGVLGFTGLVSPIAQEPWPAGTMGLHGWWPWAPTMLFAHTTVLFLLALRVRPRVIAEAIAISTLLSVALVVWAGTGVGWFALFVVTPLVLLGSALRGQRMAFAQLGEQTSLTAEERARRTLLEERSRIARELHDVVAHHMSVISIQAQVAPHLVDDPPDELKENLEGIRQNAVEALAELRRVLGVLRMEAPDDGSGTSAPHAPQPTLDRLGALVDNARGAGLTVTVEVTGDRRALAPGVELSAYRIVQEALSNALRHAPRSAVRVEVGHGPAGVWLRVVNGPPAEPTSPSPGAGHGLLGMRERTAMLGGDLTTGPTGDGGYEVTAFLPGGHPPGGHPPGGHPPGAAPATADVRQDPSPDVSQDDSTDDATGSPTGFPTGGQR
ncbi:sensor histidine kinase [Streptomyces sp. NPDC002004]